jgi:hypothetical protein
METRLSKSELADAILVLEFVPGEATENVPLEVKVVANVVADTQLKALVTFVTEIYPFILGAGAVTTSWVDDADITAARLVPK